MNKFTHIDSKGDAVMVDVSGKAITVRTAVACGRIAMSRDCYEAVKAGAMKKGDVLGVARIAGIMGAKRTSDLIPLCHILNLTKCGVEFMFHDDTSEIEGRCTVKCDGKTGVE
ncbi:MAG: cyclic pyranopterin monophosphate synthase MoaC, partial [Megasphaera elsdenii]|nr:cyclic pyranopterin monophosphate synthase MoaC [Megasphaera elsdenii]